MTKTKNGQKMEVAWTEVAKVTVKRGAYPDGTTPLVLKQHLGDGTLPNGRKFNVSVSLHTGSLIVLLEATKSDKERHYIVDPQEMVEAIVEAESLT